MDWSAFIQNESKDELESLETELPRGRRVRIPTTSPGIRPATRFPFPKIPPIRFPILPWSTVTFLGDRVTNDPRPKPDKPNPEPNQSNAGTSPTTEDAQPQGNEYTRWVQSTLNHILGLQLPLSGFMDMETRSAIRSFQKQKGLPADGIIGPDTEQALKVARRAGSSVKSNEFETFNFKAFDQEWQGEVSRTSREYIKWVQHSLNQVMGLRLPVDGINGAQTRSAVRSFQQREGLTADGIVGAQTESVIKAKLGRNAPTMTSSPMTCTGLRQPEILDLFEYNQDKLPSFHQAAIERIAKCIIASQTSATPVRSIKIVGHTDPVGSASYNLDLGKRRAEKTRVQIANVLNRLQPDLAQKFSFTVESQGETKPISSSAAKNRRVEIFVSEPKVEPLAELSSQEKAEFAKLSPENQARFTELRRTIEKYMGVARREADRGSRVLLQRGVYRARPNLLQVILDLTKITRLPSGWTLAAAKPLLIGNTLYNLSFPETINQGGTDRRGGKPDLTCFSASTQILLAHRFPVTYVRLIIQLATTSKATFAGGDSIGPLTFASTSLYKSLDSVLLQKAFDSYFNQVIGHSYTPGDELKVHRQVFGPNYPPKHATSGNPVAAFRKAFIANGGNTRLWEIINLYTRDKTNPDPKKRGNHSVVLTRIAGGRVYFYNPWANEEERNTMFGSAAVSVSGHGERPAESSMTQADFENQLTTVFHN